MLQLLLIFLVFYKWNFFIAATCPHHNGLIREVESYHIDILISKHELRIHNSNVPTWKELYYRGLNKTVIAENDHVREDPVSFQTPSIIYSLMSPSGSKILSKVLQFTFQIILN